MSRQLIAFVDATPDGKPPESEGTPAEPSAFDHWPALAHAKAGGFDHLVLISGARFRWDEVISHVPDRPLAEAAPPPEEPKAVPPAAADASAPEGAAEAAEASAPVETPVLEASSEAPAVEPPAATGPEDGDAPPPPATEDAAPAAPSETAVASSETPAAAEPKRAPRPQEPRRGPPKSIAELRTRLQHMAQTGRIDRTALETLCQELARELGAGTVACRIMPPFARDREQVSFIRSVLGLVRAQMPAALDFADGPRSSAALGLALAHGLGSLRPDVPITELTLDRSRNLGFHPRSLLHAIEIQELWREVTRGATPAALTDHMRADSRLQGLAAPYQRYARALEFGNPAEAARAARTVQQRLAEMAGKGPERDDWVAAIQPAMDLMTGALVEEQPWSRRQLWMAEAAGKRGMHFLAASHLRETLISALLETYGQNAARGWAPTHGDERPDARIRPREVMAVVLSDPHSAKLVPDLGQVWNWVGNPRNRFVMTSPVAVDPALLRDGNHALVNLPALTRAILEENRFKAIVDVLPYEAAIALALERNAVRIAPVRGRRGPPRRGEGPPHEGHEGEHGHEPGPGGDAAAPGGGEAPAERPPRVLVPMEPRSRMDNPRFRPRPDRGGPPRQDRPRFGPGPGPGPDRPREITARDRRDGPPRGPRRQSDEGSPHPGSVPVGGSIHVERAAQGLGNLGFALKSAGLNVGPRGQKERPPRKDAEAASEAPPTKHHPAESAAEASAVAAPPPPPPTVAHEPAEHSAPPPPAPDFDVAGPVSTDPKE